MSTVQSMDNGQIATNGLSKITESVFAESEEYSEEYTEGRGSNKKEESILAQLSDYIPDKSVAEEYVHRNIGGIKDFDIFEAIQSLGKNILMKGPTGAAKTMAARAYAAERDMPFVVLDCNGGIRPQDINGGWVAIGGDKHEWQPSLLAQCAYEGGVVMLDEINAMPPEMSFLLYSLLSDAREMTLSVNPGTALPRKFKAHEDLIIFAAFNPAYYGSRPMSEALEGRFIHIDWGYDAAVEKRLFNNAPLLECAKKLRGQGGINKDISTRMLMEIPMLLAELPHQTCVELFSSAFDESERGFLRPVLELHFANIQSAMKGNKAAGNPKRAEKHAAKGSQNNGKPFIRQAFSQKPSAPREIEQIHYKK